MAFFIAANAHAQAIAPLAPVFSTTIPDQTYTVGETVSLQMPTATKGPSDTSGSGVPLIYIFQIVNGDGTTSGRDTLSNGLSYTRVNTDDPGRLIGTPEAAATAITLRLTALSPTDLTLPTTLDFTVTVNAVTAPDAPTGLTATVQSGAPTKVDLGWTAPSSDGGATISDYMLQSSATGVAGTFAAISPAHSGIIPTHTATIVENAPTFFRVSATNSATLTSVFSNVASVNAGGGIAELNRIILPEVARAVIGQVNATIAARVRASSGLSAGTAHLGGQSSLAAVLTTHGQAMLDGQRSWKQVLGDAGFVLPLNAGAGSSLPLNVGAGASLPLNVGAGASLPLNVGAGASLPLNVGAGASLPLNDGAGASLPLNVSAGNGDNGNHDFAVWGSGDYRNLDGGNAGLNYDGDLFSFQVGADKRLRDNLLIGAAVSYADSALDYAGSNNGNGSYELDMLSLHPYIGWTVLNGLDLWASVGIGEGDLEMTGMPAQSVEMQTVSAGSGGLLRRVGATDLRLKSDMSLSWLEVEGGGVASQQVDAQQFRLTLEAIRRARVLESGARLTPSTEIGLRYDGGDGNTGGGIELGGNLHYANAGFTAAGKARILVGRDDYDEWGISGQVSLQPGADGQGLSISLSPGYGNTTSGVQQIWQQGLPNTAANYALRTNARLGYGINAPGVQGLLTPYTEMTYGSINSYRLGINWQHRGMFDLDLVGERSERNTTPANTILLQGRVWF